MKKIRLLSGLLAMLMLVGPLASCANGTDSEDTDAAQTQSQVTEEDTGLKDDLPALDFGNAEVTIISRDMEGWTRGEISVEKLISEPVNDAVYERNKAVEQRLGIKIVSILDKDASSEAVVNRVDTDVKSGNGEFDIMAAPAYTTAAKSVSGTFANLLNVEHLDLEKDYWTQGYNEAMEYNEMQFAATGSMLLSIYRFAFVTIFNKHLFTEANQPFLYDTVENGLWTLDKQISLVPLFHRDNGNGTQDAEGDIYGFVSSNLIGTDPYWSACDVDIVRSTDDGDLEFVFDSGKLFDVAEKVLALYYGTDDASFILSAYGSDSEQGDIRDMFADGLAAMATVRILELENASMRNMEQEYGVIPMPKFDLNQQDYHTLLHDQFTVVAIPTTITGERLERAGAVLEAMASTSWRILKPAYYETTLRTKIAQDPQSAEMMEIITRGIYIDAGIVYTNMLDSFHAGFRALVQGKQNDAVSRYTSLSRSAEKKLKQLALRLDRVKERQS